jgi:hypothetical protein
MNVSKDSIVDVFVKNTPAYTAKYIDELLRKKENYV